MGKRLAVVGRLFDDSEASAVSSEGLTKECDSCAILSARLAEDPDRDAVEAGGSAFKPTGLSISPVGREEESGERREEVDRSSQARSRDSVVPDLGDGWSRIPRIERMLRIEEQGTFGEEKVPERAYPFFCV